MAGPAVCLPLSSSAVGLRVIATNFDQVAESTAPVTCSLRLAWKPRTASTVVWPQLPVMSPGNQASWCSRCWSSRTLVPVSPSDSSDPGWVFAVSFAFVLGLAVGLSVGCAVALWLEVGLALGLDAVVVTAEGSAETPRRSTGSHAVKASTALATSTTSAFGLVACTARLLRSVIPGCPRQCGRKLPPGHLACLRLTLPVGNSPGLDGRAAKELWQT